MDWKQLVLNEIDDTLSDVGKCERNHKELIIQLQRIKRDILNGLTCYKEYEIIHYCD